MNKSIQHASICLLIVTLHNNTMTVLMPSLSVTIVHLKQSTSIELSFALLQPHCIIMMIQLSCQSTVYSPPFTIS